MRVSTRYFPAMPRPRRFRLLIWLAFVVVLFAWLHVRTWPSLMSWADLILAPAVVIATYLACTAQSSAD